MALIIQSRLSLIFLFAILLFVCPAFAADSPDSSPSPSPLPPAEDVSPTPVTPSPSPALHGSPPAPSSPSPSPGIPDSPPAPPPSDLAPNSPSPAPSTGEDDDYSYEKKNSPSPSPAPAPTVVGDINHEDQTNAGNLETKDDSSDGMSGGQKAGITIGVIAAACVVGVGAMVYKKRQQNTRRSQYGYAASRDFL